MKVKQPNSAQGRTIRRREIKMRTAKVETNPAEKETRTAAAAQRLRRMN